MKAIRWVLGRMILGLDFLTSPKPITREKSDQERIDAKTAKMALYQFQTCPFCVKVRRELKRQALSIELRDAKNDQVVKQELVSQGGKHKVPCLRIEKSADEVQWLYESDDIIAYLRTEFALSAA